jgi:hypothetical protein
MKNQKSSQKTMYIAHAQEKDIREIITELKNTNAVGIDKIQTKHIKETKQNTAKAICKLVNAIIDNELWPENLKIQIIRPIYKKGSKEDINNYRPIALLSIIDKIVEKYLAFKIRDFLDKQNLLSKVQFGYTKNKSTTDLITEINEQITNGLNEGKYAGIILVDLQKAFDTFDKKILLRKCENLGLRGKIQNILKSYLNNRKAIVQIDNKNSQLVNTKWGVPQGSVLGPLLFLIYTNNITEEITKTTIYLFADDTILISINRNYEDMMVNLQNDFNILNDWFINNELFLSEEKTIQMDIHVPKMNKYKECWIIKHYGKCKNLISSSLKSDCSVHCKKLEKKISAKYLGIHIDKNWTFKLHIEELKKKLRQMLPKMYRLRKILNIKHKKVIYDAWIRSILSYGIESYGHTSEYLIDKLQRVQNKIVKILFETKNKERTLELYKNNKIFKINELRDYIIMTKNYYSNQYKTKTKNTDRIRLNKRKFELPLWNNVYGKRRKEWYIPYIFNNLKDNMLNYQSLKEFKDEIKNDFLNNY